MFHLFVPSIVCLGPLSQSLFISRFVLFCYVQQPLSLSIFTMGNVPPSQSDFPNYRLIADSYLSIAYSFTSIANQNRLIAEEMRKFLNVPAFQASALPIQPERMQPSLTSIEKNPQSSKDLYQLTQQSFDRVENQLKLLQSEIDDQKKLSGQR
jgi:hypothetical protein